MDPISMGLSAIGSLFKGVTSLIAGANQQKSLQNAALQAREEGGVNAQTAVQEGNAVAASAAVGAAANGGGFEGSTLGLIRNLGAQAMFNARAQTYRAMTISQRDIYEGKVAMAQGVQGAISSAIEGAGSLVGGMAKAKAGASMLKSAGGGADLGDAAGAVPF